MQREWANTVCQPRKYPAVKDKELKKKNLRCAQKIGSAASSGVHCYMIGNKLSSLGATLQSTAKTIENAYKKNKIIFGHFGGIQAESQPIWNGIESSAFREQCWKKISKGNLQGGLDF